jgi:hypothetical protein
MRRYAATGAGRSNVVGAIVRVVVGAAADPGPMAARSQLWDAGGGAMTDSDHSDRDSVRARMSTDGFVLPCPRLLFGLS